MSSKNFEVGDYVWAKMKGYPPWPGKIIEPPSNSKSKSKKSQYVFFLGSENCAWISDDNIQLHSEHNLQKYGLKKGSTFVSGLQTLIQATKDDPKYQRFFHSSKKGNEDATEIDFESSATSNQSKIESPQKTTITKRKKAYLPLKSIIPQKKFSQKKKAIRKQNRSSPTESTGSSSCKTKEDASSHAGSLLSADSIYMPMLVDSSSSELKIAERKYCERPKSPPINLTDASTFMKGKIIVPTKSIIGFLGLSTVGQAIVRNLCVTGHSIIIWNETPDECKRLAGRFKLQIAETPAQVIQAADITFCYMSDTHAVEQLFKNSDFFKEVERSTTTCKGFVALNSMDPKLSELIGSEIKIKGGRYLEAPISGSKKEADEGTFFIQAAGDKELYDDCKSCLDAITKKNDFVSAEVGTAMKHNIVYNMLMGTVYAALGESMTMVNHSNVRNKDFKEVLACTDLNSAGVSEKVSSMIDNDYTADITLKHMYQQFNLGMALSDEVSQRTPLFAAAKEVYKKCSAMQYGDHDVSAVYEETQPIFEETKQ